MKRELKLLPINDIVPSALNLYDIEDGVPDMVQSIKINGLITPLSVIGPDNGKYELLSGERRYTALTIINEETGDYSQIPCYIIGNSDMDEKMKQLIIESANIETRDFDKKAHIFNIIKLLKDIEKEDSDTELAKKLKDYLQVSDRYRRAYVAVYNGGEDFVNTVVDNNTKIMDAAQIAKWSDEEREDATRRINEGEIASDIINDHNEKKKQEEAEMKKAYAEKFDEFGEYDNVDDDYGEDVDEYDADSMSNEDILAMLGGSDYSSTDDYTEDSSNTAVTKFISKMLKKDSYTYEEVEIIEKMADLVDHYNSL